MAHNATQYLVPLKDLVELIIKKEGIHEGHWALSVGMQIGMGAFGPSPDQQLPGAAVTIHNIGIQKVEESNVALLKAPWTLNAAVVNPKISEKALSKKKST